MLDMYNFSTDKLDMYNFGTDTSDHFYYWQMWVIANVKFILQGGTGSAGKRGHDGQKGSSVCQMWNRNAL